MDCEQKKMFKKNLKKKIIAGALALISAVSLCGCSDGDWDDYEEYDSEETSYEDNSNTNTEKSDSDFTDTNISENTLSGDRASSLVLGSDGNVTITRKQRAEETPMGEDGTWTVFVYLCGSDLESESGLGVSDMEEMSIASTSQNIKFVVQAGGAASWSDYDIPETRHNRFVITGGNITLVDDVSQTNMGDSSTLTSFLNWGIENYPAAKMGLVFWNHGGGSITGVCFDENYDYDSLSLKEIDNSLTSVFDNMTDKFEFIGFDACLMATVENASMLVPHARYMYASEELEPGYGWDYIAIGNYLDRNPDCDGAELGKVVADSFYASCDDIGEGDNATFSVTDLSKIDDLVTAVNKAAESMNSAADDSSALASMVRGINSARNYGGNNKSEGYTNMVDLGALMSAVSDNAAAANEVLAAIDNAVIYNIYGDNESGSTGLSTYYPLMVSGSEELSIFKDICISPYYMTFIDRIAYGSANGGSVDDYSADDTWLSDGAEYWNDDEDYDFFSDFWSIFDSEDDTGIDFVSDDSSIYFSEEPHVNDNGIYTFTFDSDSIDNVGSVNCSVYYVDDKNECLYELGIDSYVSVDWDTGVVEDLFDALWYTLPDSQLLAMYVVEQNDGYDVFSSPILLNGSETNLRIKYDYSGENAEISILGVWDGVNSSGQASKTIYQLSEGDVIVPLYYTYDFDGSYIDITEGYEYTFDGNSSVYLNYLPDTDYQYSFEINDIFGNTYYTDFTTFAVEGCEAFFYKD